MLTIIKASGQEIDWHIGEENKFRKLYCDEDISLNDAIAVQADCDELYHIKDKFQNIPQRQDTRVVCWFGDDAKFIAWNL